MSQKCIKRTTLFKIPKEEDIPIALNAYKELERTAVKVSLVKLWLAAALT